MKKNTFLKIILSAFMTGCLVVFGAGCGNSSETSVPTGTSDENSTVSAEESIDNASSEAVVVVTSENGSPENVSEISSGESTDDAGMSENPSEISTAESSDDVVSEESVSETSTAEISDDTSAGQVEKSDESASKSEEDDEDKNGNIVVMLDPGHDDDESPRNHEKLGVNEQDLNLKIGLACYERLSQYKGITPYLTRSDGHCPNADGQFSGIKDCIHKRAYLAEEKNADFFVSLHCDAINDEFGTEANGISVYITNYPEFSGECEKLGNIIIDHVTKAVDLGSRGVFLNELDEEKGYYKDGSIKDKLYLLSYNVDNDRPALVVEHGFMDNVHDNAILKNDEKLRLIGQADADAIAEYYGLELK